MPDPAISIKAPKAMLTEALRRDRAHTHASSRHERHTGASTGPNRGRPRGASVAEVHRGPQSYLKPLLAEVRSEQLLRLSSGPGLLHDDEQMLG